MALSDHFAWATQPSRREARVDLLRGIALICIFIDHVPRNVLNWFTLRNFGFSDAAELFVLLAGFASMNAYGRSFARDGISAGLRKVARRCLYLYVFQIGLALLTFLLVWSYADIWSYTTHTNLVPLSMAPVLSGGIRGVGRTMTLTSQPANLNILPLYILLLSLFPLIYFGMRQAPRVTVGLSAALWIAAYLLPDMNLINTIDDEFWYFNPFAWQFLFTLGAALAVVMNNHEGLLPRHDWLVALCWAYLLFGLVEGFPWTEWGLPDLAPIAIETTDKTDLAPIRLLHVLALVYVALTSSLVRSSMRVTVLRWIEICGRHSLEVFSLGTVLALLGRLAMRDEGAGPFMQIAVNVIGLSAMVGLALLLDQRRRRASGAASGAEHLPSRLAT